MQINLTTCQILIFYRKHSGELQCDGIIGRREQHCVQPVWVNQQQDDVQFQRVRSGVVPLHDCEWTELLRSYLWRDCKCSYIFTYVNCSSLTCIQHNLCKILYVEKIVSVQKKKFLVPEWFRYIFEIHLTENKVYTNNMENKYILVKHITFY